MALSSLQSLNVCLIISQTLIERASDPDEDAEPPALAVACDMAALLQPAKSCNVRAVKRLRERSGSDATATEGIRRGRDITTVMGDARRPWRACIRIVAPVRRPVVAP